MRGAGHTTTVSTSTFQCGKWAVAFWFALSTMGLPLDEWTAWLTPTTTSVSNACALKPGTACQCSPALRRTGRCCCQMAHPVKPTAKCCASRTKSVAKGCCTAAKPATASEPSSLPLLTTCGCGSGDLPGMLWSGDPRVIPPVVTLMSAAAAPEHHALGDESGVGTRPQPSVPPPRDRLLSV